MGSLRKVIIFLSGRGSNFKSLLDYQRRTTECPFEIAGVFSDKPAAGGLEFAREVNIPVKAFDRGEFRDFASFKKAIFDAADDAGADYIALAGYMQIVPDWFVHKWFGRLINIHPSLLPKLPGLDTHKRAIEAGEAVHGCSVHFVDTGVDTGPLIAQAAVKVEPGDCAESLAARVLAREHAIYPWALSCIANGSINLVGGRVLYSQEALDEGAARGFTLFPTHALP